MVEPTRAADGSEVLGAAVRRLVEAVVRTQAPAEQVLTAVAAVDAATAALSGDLRDGPCIPDYTDPFSNALSIVSGGAHPLAPPVQLRGGPDGIEGSFRLGSAYEGAPGLAHGGILSLVLDHALSQAAFVAGHGGMTVSLDLRYLAPTPLHTELVAQARLVQAEGRKVRLEGSIRCGDTTTVAATGVFLTLDSQKAAMLFPHLAAG
jgi:acyl-coenzyme A thioesterase PaaI-like protein